MPRITLTKRLELFRQEAYARGFGEKSSSKEANWTKAFFELYSGLPLRERQARSFAYALVHEPVYIHPHTRIAGQVLQRCPGDTSPETYGASDPRWRDYSVYGQGKRIVAERVPENAQYVSLFGDSPHDGAMGGGHVCWDWGIVLERGVQGMLNQYAQAERKTTDSKSIEFYHGVQIVLDALLKWVTRHVQALSDAAAAETDSDRKARLLEMAAVCERVPRLPPRTFREAVQAFWFQYMAVALENPFGGIGPGRLDYYLWPYLKRDLESGCTTLEETTELLLELFIKLHERIANFDKSVEAIVVGGREKDGRSAINPLSHLIVEVAMALKQTHPSVYMRLPDDAPGDFVDLAVRYLLEGENRAQIHGDDEIIRAFHADGVAIEDARHWCAGGCMEVGVQGASGGFVFAFAHNTPLTLEVVLNRGRTLLTSEPAAEHPKELGDYQSFDELLADFEAEFTREIRVLMRRLDIYLELYGKYRPAFLLSSMTHDCLERGRAIDDGGARYPCYGGSAVGIPNVGDSLHAIRRAVFDEKRVSGKELLQALRANYQGYEGLRSYLLNLPKYGCENAEADALTDWVLRLYNKTVKAHRNPFGGHCRPIILSFTRSVLYGSRVGASPDGRFAKQPLAQSLSPQSGAAVKGLTAAINSATSLSLAEVSGGASMMWDLDVNWATPEVVRPVLLTFFHKGGHIFQGNIIDVSTLREAQKHPERFADLMVRVGGFSARFVALSQEMQDEVITRHRYRG